MVYLARALGFYMQNGSTEGAFYSEGSSIRWLFAASTLLKWTVSTEDSQLTHPEGGPKDNNTYTKSSSGEDDINTEGSIVSLYL